MSAWLNKKYRERLTVAIAMDSTKAHIGICNGVVVTSRTTELAAGRVMVKCNSYSLAAPKFRPRSPRYHEEGTGK